MPSTEKQWRSQKQHMTKDAFTKFTHQPSLRRSQKRNTNCTAARESSGAVGNPSRMTASINTSICFAR
jgi:hypothetical protein